MTETCPAFSLSPVPQPGPEVAPPELFRGIYGMPMFVTLTTADLDASTRFWTEGLGFFEFYALPGQVVHLRRWAFQDVLLVPGEDTSGAGPGVTFACVLSQLDEIAAACERLAPGSVTGPAPTPWNTTDVTVTTPEGARVIMTAARVYDPDSHEAQQLREGGIDGPR